MTPVSANDPSARYSSANTAMSAATIAMVSDCAGALLLLDAAADLDEVAGRQLKP